MFECIKRSIDRYITVADAIDEWGKEIVNKVLELVPDAADSAERLHDLCGCLQSNLRLTEEYTKRGASIRPRLTQYKLINERLSDERDEALRNIVILKDKHRKERREMVRMTFNKIDDYKRVCDNKLYNLKLKLSVSNEENKRLEDKREEGYNINIKLEEKVDELKSDRAVLRASNVELTRKLEEANRALEQLMKLKS